MSVVTKWIAVPTAAALLIAFGLFVWPTPYRPDRIQLKDGVSLPVRINRVTGKAEALYPDGWRSMPAIDKSHPESLKSMLAPDRGGINLSQLRWSSSSYIQGPVYNPTNYTLRELVIRVEVYDKKNGKKRLERDYRETTYINARTAGNIIFNAGFSLEPGQSWNIHVVDAKGTPEVEIKTAKDFIEWKLSVVLGDPDFLALTLEERKKMRKELAEGSWAKQFPEFMALPQGEQAKVLEFLKKQEEN